ncbi:WW domain-binding protein 11 isoform X2 [Daktulosphaira vitifoliae]|uniref:WW domain-binding protein 11 isoform X2 n=1 Tax=Daktulosphaira vitifoliae TaxID=58002 RepID=UPI0021AA9E42|nr:WW domain-binding protein 11 isoform X2 [Daktulosphaira vitifoliae]
MGRRSINTTKSGKYMNPTDQARKEARKKELKKNKKQRMIVRTTVLKGKDPLQILSEMEKIDQMEYNVVQPSPLNEKVLREKRRKLKETFDRVMKMYVKDELDKYHEIKRAESEYEKRRFKLISYFDAVKTAQQVSVDEIPLPVMTSNIPLPAPDVTIDPPIGILKKPPLYTPPLSPISGTKKRPPGVPPGIPPPLTDEENDDDVDDDDSDNEIAPRRNLRFAEPDDSSKENRTDDIEMFMREIDEVQRKSLSNKYEEHHTSIPTPSGHLPPGLPPSIPVGVPPPMPYRGPAGRMPPGPPPGRPPMLPPGPPPGLPPRMHIRMPPGPPPGMPPRMIRYNAGMHHNANPSPNTTAATPNIVSAEPQLINREEPHQIGSTIEAKPKMRNLAADVTRFLPTSIRVKRDDGKSNRREHAWEQHKAAELKTNIAANNQQVGQQTKDDAYMQFMQEMEGLL